MITGVFTDTGDAVESTNALQELLGQQHVNLLAPTKSVGDEPDEVPITEDMPPALGRMGGIFGGAVGLASAAAIPGVGQVAGLGVVAGAILGVLGGVAGYKIGDTADRIGTTGIPADELYFYKDALTTGRSVVIAAVEHKDDEERVREILAKNGAESLDAARSNWAIGLHDAGEEKFDATQVAD
jgi:hypothetical protein